MKSKLVAAALGALLLGGAAIAAADDHGRQPRNGPAGQYRPHDRGWDSGARWNQQGRSQWHHPGRHPHWQPQYWKQPPRWAYGYYPYPGYYWKPYPGGDDITIIFRGRIN